MATGEIKWYKKLLMPLVVSVGLLVPTLASAQYTLPYNGGPGQGSGYGKYNILYEERYNISGLEFTGYTHSPRTKPYNHRMIIEGREHIVAIKLARALQVGEARYRVAHPNSEDSHEQNFAGNTDISIYGPSYFPDRNSNGGRWGYSTSIVEWTPLGPNQIMGWEPFKQSNAALSNIDTYMAPLAVPDGARWGYEPGSHGTFFRGGLNSVTAGGSSFYTTLEGSPPVRTVFTKLSEPTLKELMDGTKVTDEFGVYTAKGYIGYFGPLFPRTIHINDVKGPGNKPGTPSLSPPESASETLGEVDWWLDRDNAWDNTRENEERHTDLKLKVDLRTEIYKSFASRNHKYEIIADGKTYFTHSGDKINKEYKFPSAFKLEKNKEITVRVKYEFTNYATTSSSGGSLEIYPDWSKKGTFVKDYKIKVAPDYKVKKANKKGAQVEVFGKGKSTDNRWEVGKDYLFKRADGTKEVGTLTKYPNSGITTSKNAVNYNRNYFEWIEKTDVKTDNTHQDSYKLKTQTGIPVGPGDIKYYTDFETRNPSRVPKHPHPGRGLRGVMKFPTIDNSAGSSTYKFQQVESKGLYSKYVTDISIMSMKTGIVTKHNLVEDVAEKKYRGVSLNRRGEIQGYLPTALGQHKTKVGLEKTKVGHDSAYLDVPMFAGTGGRPYEAFQPELLQRWYIPIGVSERNLISTTTYSTEITHTELSPIPKENLTFTHKTDGTASSTFAYKADVNAKYIGLNYGMLDYIVPFEYEYNLIGQGKGLTAPFLVVAPQGLKPGASVQGSRELKVEEVVKFSGIQKIRERKGLIHGYRYPDHDISGVVK